MFGYTRAYIPNLRFREYEKYKSYYCGVCKAMGKLLGQKARLSLTYEAATLAMLVDYCALKSEPELKKGRCAVHPVHKRPYYFDTPGIFYSARVNVMLSGLACEDNISDSRSLKSRAAHLALRKATKKAAAKYPDLYDFIRTNLKDLSDLEKANTSDPDAFTEPFGKILGRIFTVDGLVSEQYADTLYKLGNAVGRWIMLIDALEDREKDRKKKNFNIYNNILGDRPASESDEIVRVRFLTDADGFWHELKAIRSELGVLPDPDTEGFMDNLFSEGLAFIDRDITKKASGEELSKEAVKPEEPGEKPDGSV